MNALCRQSKHRELVPTTQPYVAPFGKYKYCERCAERQSFGERFTPLCKKCEGQA